MLCYFILQHQLFELMHTENIQVIFNFCYKQKTVYVCIMKKDKQNEKLEFDKNVSSHQFYLTCISRLYWEYHGHIMWSTRNSYV